MQLQPAQLRRQLCQSRQLRALQLQALQLQPALAQRLQRLQLAAPVQLQLQLQLQLAQQWRGQRAQRALWRALLQAALD